MIRRMLTATTSSMRLNAWTRRAERNHTRPRSSLCGYGARRGRAHERLDGKGYPRQLTDASICPMTRIISTADVFDALTADRPYRAAMRVSDALAIMRTDVDAAIDATCFAALEQAIARAG
jgi:hypothetical protein